MDISSVICGRCYFLGITIFLPPLPHRSLSLEGRSLRKTPPCRTHSLHTVWLWVSVLISIYYRKLLWWGLSVALIYGYNNKTLKIILLLCTFSRIKAFSFPLGPQPTQGQALGHCGSVGYWVCLMEWLLKPITKQELITPVTWVPLLLQHILQACMLLSWVTGLVAGWYWCSHPVAHEGPSSTIKDSQ